MNKGLLIGIVALLLAGIGGYFAYTSMSNDSEEFGERLNSSDTAMVEKDNDSFNGTFVDLLKLGKDYTCTFDQEDEAGNKTSGEVFVASRGDKLRGDFNFVQPDGASYDGGMVRDGEYNYVWTSQFGGFKSKVTEADDSLFSSSDNDSTSTGGLSDDTDVDFDCKSWRVDESKFIPPSDIEFQDFSQEMQQIEEAEDLLNDLEIDCSVCDSAPEGAARTQCLQALGC